MSSYQILPLRTNSSIAISSFLSHRTLIRSFAHALEKHHGSDAGTGLKRMPTQRLLHLMKINSGMEYTTVSRSVRPNYRLKITWQLAQAVYEPKVPAVKLGQTHGINVNMLIWLRQYSAGLLTYSRLGELPCYLFHYAMRRTRTGTSNRR